MNHANEKSLESWIWDSACSIRGALEAPKFKDFILPLIFANRLCDIFDDELLSKQHGVLRGVFVRPLFRLLSKQHRGKPSPIRY